VDPREGMGKEKDRHYIRVYTISPESQGRSVPLTPKGREEGGKKRSSTWRKESPLYPPMADKRGKQVTQLIPFRELRGERGDNAILRSTPPRGGKKKPKKK